MMKTARSILCLLLAAVFLAALIPGCSCGKPKQDAIQQNDSGEQTSDNSETPWHTADFAAEVTDIGQCYTRGFSEEDVVLSEDGFTEFVRNEVLLVAAMDAPYDEVKALIEANGGEIVGYIELTGDYQAAFSDKTEQELNRLIETFEQSPLIDDAMLDYVMELDESSLFINDPWSNDENAHEAWYEGEPYGNNWGMEAINARGAWEYAKEFSNIIIGIIDGGTDVEHEDLKEILERNEYFEKDPGNLSHGTHVLGIFAAVANNGKGVTGVFPNKILGEKPVAKAYSFAVNPEHKETLIYFKEVCVELIARNVKVINCSMTNGNVLAFAASAGEERAIRHIEIFADALGKILNTLLEKGYDFVICQGAGNTSLRNEEEARNAAPANLFVRDDAATFGWREVAKEEVNILECVCNKCGRVYDEIKTVADWEDLPKDFSCEHCGAGKEAFNIKKDLPEGACFGKVDAKYISVFAAIDDKYPDVKKRIIVVGAVQNEYSEQNGFKKEYSVCLFSNWGERVDVLAPGAGIFSTIPENENGERYGLKDGTSMASPHVAGVAAMVWAANNRLKGDEVADIVITTAYECQKIRDDFKSNDVIHYDFSYVINGMLDARAAVQEAILRRGSSENPGFENKDLGSIVTKVVTKEGENPVAGCEVKVYPIINGAAADNPLDFDAPPMSDNNGDVYLMLEPGESESGQSEPRQYLLVVDHEDYQYASIIVSVTANEVTYAEWIKLTPAQTVAVCGNNVYAIREDNSLWTWKSDFYRKDGAQPRKIMENAKTLSVLWDKAYVIDRSNTLFELAETPKPILNNVSRIKPSEGFIYAICTDNSLWGWGSSYGRRLADGTESSETPVKITDGVKDFDSCCGMYFAVRTDGQLLAWGNGEYCGYYDEYSEDLFLSLGNGTTEGSDDPVLITDDVSSVICETIAWDGDGYSHLDGCTCYIIKNDGSLWGWGYNKGYNLGDGTNENRTSPVKILEQVAEFIPRTEGACFARTNDGAVWSWGRGELLGLGDTKIAEEPQMVAENVRELVVGNYHAYAVRNDNILIGWGYSGSTAPLGDEEMVSRRTPQYIANNVETIAKVYDGYGSDLISENRIFVSLTYIIKTDGSLWGWGYGGDYSYDYEDRYVSYHVPCGAYLYSIIGDGYWTTRYSPVSIMENAYEVISVASEYPTRDAVVLANDGSVWSWGYDYVPWTEWQEDGENPLKPVNEKLSPVKVFDGVKMPGSSGNGSAGGSATAPTTTPTPTPTATPTPTPAPTATPAPATPTPAPITPTPEPTQNPDGGIVFVDPEFEGCVRRQLSHYPDGITEENLLKITRIRYMNYNFKSIVDIQKLKNLEIAELDYDKITDISPLSEMTKLGFLSLSHNKINDISALRVLTKLESLYLDSNEISDVSALSGLVNLQAIHLGYNSISDVSPLVGLNKVTNLYLLGNNISDITPLSTMTNLRWIDLRGNPLTEEQVEWLEQQLPRCTIIF